jgi:hypothetical protein
MNGPRCATTNTVTHPGRQFPFQPISSTAASCIRYRLRRQQKIRRWRCESRLAGSDAGKLLGIGQWAAPVEFGELAQRGRPADVAFALDAVEPAGKKVWVMGARSCAPHPCRCISKLQTRYAGILTKRGPLQCALCAWHCGLEQRQCIGPGVASIADRATWLQVRNSPDNPASLRVIFLRLDRPCFPQSDQKRQSSNAKAERQTARTNGSYQQP